MIILIELSNLGLHPFFVDAVGGTGKTFLFNALLAKWRSERKVIPAVASTGIAALLLSQARTAHSSFKVHFDAMGLKVGSPVILLHNMDPAKGLFNGTKFIVRQVLSRTLKLQIVNGSHAGQEVWMTRIDLPTAENFYPLL